MHSPLKAHALARFRLARIFAAMILRAIGMGLCSDTRYLRPTQQHIAALPPPEAAPNNAHFRQKTPNSHYFRRKTPAKTAIPAHCQNRKYARWNALELRHLLTLLLHHQRLPLLMQIAALGGDIERVL